MLPTIFQTVLSPMKAYEAALPRVESLGVPGDGWIRITLPNGREDIYCSPLEAGYQQLENIAFTGDATLIRHDSDGTLLDWAVIGGTTFSIAEIFFPLPASKIAQVAAR